MINPSISNKWLYSPLFVHFAKLLLKGTHTRANIIGTPNLGFWIKTQVPHPQEYLLAFYQGGKPSLSTGVLCLLALISMCLLSKPFIIIYKH